MTSNLRAIVMALKRARRQVHGEHYRIVGKPLGYLITEPLR